MIANGVFNGSGGELISTGVAIIAGSVVVAVIAIVAVVRIDRRGEGKIGCLGALGAVALFIVIALCLVSTAIGILFAGCGFLVGH